jgi:ring-1,2-phenylacetyl-CoA epoxidase subunit PaaC
VAVDPATLRPAFDARVGAVFSEATLGVPDVAPAVTGGRRGVHTQSMGYLLAEMQHLARSHPGATW